jgi:hypothetical protein
VNECEICLEPDSAMVIITIQLPEVPPNPIDLCDECLRLVFGAMMDRYKAAIEEHNVEVRGLMRVLGFEVPS